MPDIDPYKEIVRLLEEMPVPPQATPKYGRVQEAFYADQVSPNRLDDLFASGWRHFAESFYRYDRTLHDGVIRDVLPLRVRLSNFEPSKSHRRNLRKNADLMAAYGPADVSPEIVELFGRHRTRFTSNRPDSPFDYLSLYETAWHPCEVKELRVYDDRRLVAVSFFDVGKQSVSGIYAMFEPELSARGLGIFTMLKEIEWAIETDREFYYLGYAYAGESFYDYKKRFRGTEVFDWKDRWETFEEPS